MVQSDQPTCETYSIREAAKKLGIGRNTAYEAAQRGEIPCLKIGGRLLVPKTALHRLLDAGSEAEK